MDVEISTDQLELRATQRRFGVQELGVRGFACVEQLAALPQVARQKAVALREAGKNSEAIAALKRAKAVEKQLSAAQATHAALEQQVDLLESAELQREVSDALSASASSVKKKSKGLLSKTENAVDEASELRDLAEDVTVALGGLATHPDEDDDELLAELDAMVADEAPAVAAPVAAPVTAPVAAAPVTMPAAPVAPVAPSVAQFPSAPTGMAAAVGGVGGVAAAGTEAR